MVKKATSDAKASTTSKVDGAVAKKTVKKAAPKKAAAPKKKAKKTVAKKTKGTGIIPI